MKTVAFLPAKGSSSRIKAKNLRLMDSKPLFLYTLEKLMKCDFIDEVYLDSESDEVLNFAPYLNYFKLKRDPNLADNRTDGHQLFYNEVCQVDADIYIQILGTSPFIKIETIKKAVDILKKDEHYDSVVLVKRDKQYTWSNENPTYDRNHIPNSVDLPDTIIESMGLYVIRRDAAISLKQRFGNSVYLLDAEPIEAVDVNFESDFILADTIAKGINQSEISTFRTLSKHLSSCIFSDILWEYGIKSVITGLTPNLINTKIMGRANTLAIRKLNPGEDINGIYDGLKTYERIRSGEIIIVENECPECAYFGELNANLAIRSGAIGTIVAGVTRDINEVTSLEYPVFAKGYSCSDVRGVATIKSHNQRITIQNVTINPRDLIFADRNGIVVIPQTIEKEVLAKAIQSIKTESAVLTKVTAYENAFQIYQEEGAF